MKRANSSSPGPNNEQRVSRDNSPSSTSVWLNTSPIPTPPPSPGHHSQRHTIDDPFSLVLREIMVIYHAISAAAKCVDKGLFHLQARILSAWPVRVMRLWEIIYPGRDLGWNIQHEGRTPEFNSACFDANHLSPEHKLSIFYTDLVRKVASLDKSTGLRGILRNPGVRTFEFLQLYFKTLLDSWVIVTRLAFYISLSKFTPDNSSLPPVNKNHRELHRGLQRMPIYIAQAMSNQAQGTIYEHEYCLQEASIRIATPGYTGQLNSFTKLKSAEDSACFRIRLSELGKLILEMRNPRDITQHITLTWSFNELCEVKAAVRGAAQANADAFIELPRGGGSVINKDASRILSRAEALSFRVPTKTESTWHSWGSPWKRSTGWKQELVIRSLALI